MSSPESENAVAIARRQDLFVGRLPGHRTMQRLDPATGNWDQLAPLPDGRDHALAIGYDGGVWIFGGFSGGQGDPIASWRFDIATDTYEQLPEFVSVGASGGACSTGTSTSAATTARWSSTTRARARSASSRVPARGLRDHSQVVAYLGEIWMLGGRESSTTRLPDAEHGVTIWDPVCETWRNGPPMARAHSGFSAAVVHDQIFVGGRRVQLVRSA